MNEPIVIESNQNHATITSNGICPTLSAAMGMGGGYVPMIVEIYEREDNPNNTTTLFKNSYIDSDNMSDS